KDLLIPAGRHTLSPREVGQRQRERLIRAMVLCTSEQGYSETTIADVVRVARTSRSAFYEHFADKEACFVAAYAQMTSAFIKASLQAAARVDSWEQMLEAGIVTYFRFMAEHPEVAVATVVEIHSAGRDFGVRSEEHTSELQSRRDLVCRLLLEKKKNIALKPIFEAVEGILYSDKGVIIMRSKDGEKEQTVVSAFDRKGYLLSICSDY